MKFKIQIDGKETEVDLTEDQLKAAGLISQTTLLESDELFDEAAEMRGFKGKKTSSELNSVIKQIGELKKVVDAQKTIIEKISNEKATAESEVQKYLESQREKEINAQIEAAVKDGRITPEAKTKWIERLKSSYDSSLEVLNELPKNPALNKDNNGNGNGNDKPAGGGSARTGNAILDSIKEHNANAVIQDN